MKKNNDNNGQLKFDSVSDVELISMVISYLAFLSSELPTNLLKDTCAGARASLYALYLYFKKLPK